MNKATEIPVWKVLIGGYAYHVASENATQAIEIAVNAACQKGKTYTERDVAAVERDRYIFVRTKANEVPSKVAAPVSRFKSSREAAKAKRVRKAVK